jgi:hypothetical protein
VALAGIYAKYYNGPAEAWVNDSLGGLLYVVFWCLFVFFVAPRVRSVSIAAWVLAVTALLETAQLWHPRWLEAVRRTLPGAALLGTTFVWSDFLYYIAGAAIGAFAVEWVRRLTGPEPN